MIQRSAPISSMPRTMASAKRKQVDSPRKLRDEAPKRPKQVDAHMSAAKYAIGERSLASLKRALAKALQVPISYFFPEDDSKAGIASRIAILEKELARLRKLL